VARPASLIRIVLWAHQLLAEVLSPGDTAVDLTAGNGADTLFLAAQVGPAGRVLAFDVQRQALQNTADRLFREGIRSRYCSLPEAPLAAPGVYLIHDSHERLERYLDGPAQVLIANLGYLPGGDPALVTRASSTLTAIRQGLERLNPTGRLAVVTYVGHPAGGEESRRIESLLQGLSSRHWHIVRLQVVNREQAPYLLVVEKR
jgi:16S rRNA C1402 N4-methylase RsmH